MTSKKNIRSIGVFCGSSNSIPDPFRETAYELGREIGRRGYNLVYGGASIGLMGCVARGVHEENGTVVGALPKFFMQEEIKYEEADELIVTEDMRERKAVMDDRSDAFIALPGGIGTLEEAVEILSMKQLRLTAKPLVFLNVNQYFDSLFAWFQSMVDLQFAKPETLDLYAIHSTPKNALDYIQNYQPPHTGPKWF